MGFYLESWFSFLVMGWSAENTEEKKKTDRIKALKSEEKEKRRIRGKSNNNNLVVDYTFLENIVKKKLFIPLYYEILFRVLL